MTAPASNLDIRMHNFQILGIPLQICDEWRSTAANIVAQEMSVDEYKLATLHFQPGDCVLDIGGHIGMFSVFMAKRYPGIRIWSYEPHPHNRLLFQANVQINQVTGIELYPEAVTGCGGPVELAGDPINSGAYSAFTASQDHSCATAGRSLTLDQVFERHAIERCVLLKIDCEGSEYEILQNTTAWPRIAHLRGEFHMNKVLASRGYSMQKLFNWCAEKLPTRSVAVKFCAIND